MLKELNENIRETHCTLIAHGVNAQGVMGSGVAKVLSDKCPEVKTSYINYCKLYSRPNMLLGKVQIAHLNDGKTKVANCFTQQNYGKDGQVYLNYEALQECIESLYDYAIENGHKEIAISRIGCGLAGGDWEIVKSMLTFNIRQNLIVNVYYLA